jgi:hypothetical protein
MDAVVHRSIHMHPRKSHLFVEHFRELVNYAGKGTQAHQNSTPPLSSGHLKRVVSCPTRAEARIPTLLPREAQIMFQCGARLTRMLNCGGAHSWWPEMGIWAILLDFSALAPGMHVYLKDQPLLAGYASLRADHIPAKCKGTYGVRLQMGLGARKEWVCEPHLASQHVLAVVACSHGLGRPGSAAYCWWRARTGQ